MGECRANRERVFVFCIACAHPPGRCERLSRGCIEELLDPELFVVEVFTPVARVTFLFDWTEQDDE